MGPLKKLRDRIQGKAPAGVRRSSRWPELRRQHLKKNPACAACGGTKKVEVHHIQPFHIRPDLELDPSNLLTLCEAKRYGVNCHLAWGHAGDYRAVNTDVERDAERWASLLDRRKGI